MTGEELKAIRLSRKITQRQLGEKLGYEGKMARRMVQSWEYNERPIPLYYFRKLAQILDVPVERFVP